MSIYTQIKYMFVLSSPHLIEYNTIVHLMFGTSICTVSLFPESH